MKIFVNKLTKQKEFTLSNEVSILCNINELENFMKFIEDAYNSLSKIDGNGLPHSHYKDYIKNKNSSDIIIVLEKTNE
jgi:hypothetical protein